jgi:hypothetical protein
MTMSLDTENFAVPIRVVSRFDIAMSVAHLYRLLVGCALV